MAKRLVVCCDGTWNRRDQRKHGTPTATNVSKLAAGVARQDLGGKPQLVLYQQGVGTRRLERLRGGAVGFGLSRNVRECYRFLVENYQPGDELYLFGFSRGAFTARSTAGLVRNAGMLRAGHLDRVDEAYRLYRAREDTKRPSGSEAQRFRSAYSHPEGEIKFVGVWDTVGSLGIPIGFLRLPFLTRRWSFHDTTLSSYVRFAHHALAIDERRRPFKPTLWQQQREASGQTLEQVWFAGVHSDVGGGYPDPDLADISLVWMVQRAREAGLAIDPEHFELSTPPIDPERRALGAQTAPDALAPMHESRKGIYRLAPPHVRPLDADGGAASSSAVRRLEEPGYVAANLDDWMKAAGRVANVADRPTLSAQSASGPSTRVPSG